MRKTRKQAKSCNAAMRTDQFIENKSNQNDCNTQPKKKRMAGIY